MIQRYNLLVTVWLPEAKNFLSLNCRRMRPMEFLKMFLKMFGKESLINLLASLREHLRMKKISRLQLMEFFGLLDGRLNYETLQFETSKYLKFKTYLKQFMVASVVFKMFVSPFFPQTDSIQLLIGSVYNAFPEEPRLVNCNWLTNNLETFCLKS